MSNSPMWGDADEAMARVASQVAEAEERAIKARQLREEMDALVATVSSPQGEVTVTSDVTGRMTSLQLSDAGMNLSANALSALIVKTAAAAAWKAGQLAIELAAESFGEDSAVTSRLRDELASRAPADDSLGFRAEG